jgi:phosphoribosylanthranilate isomerase|tara:strand:- start:208 stop:858 length:651 start_codon:yes stop_codon:yes gene_type:complete
MLKLNKSKIKICGIKKIDNLKTCIELKVSYFGLIFYPNSPRNVSVDLASKLLTFAKDKKIFSVGVFVDKPIKKLKNILSKIELNCVQLHGNEDNSYIIELKKHTKSKIIKNIAIKNKGDFQNIKKFPDVDIFLFDYKPNKNELPGGNSKSFSWNLIKNLKIEKPWFLSGGINIKNINDIKNYAIPYGIDISSGVEDKLGIKNNKKIIELINEYKKN